MTKITLNKTETAILVEAAAVAGGEVTLPATMKQVTAQRILGRLLKAKLIEEFARGDEAVHRLVDAGYRTIGLEPPATALKDLNIPPRQSKRDRSFRCLPGMRVQAWRS